MEPLINYILNRLHEGTTWAAIFTLAASFGLNLSPEQTAGIAGLAMVLLPNKFNFGSK